MSSQRLLLLALILAGFFLRAWELPHTPPGLWYDEAYNAMDALWMAETGRFQPFVVGNNGREAMWHHLALLSISLLGQTAFAVRWVGAVVGVVTLPVLYRFTLLVTGPFVESVRQRRWLALAAVGWLAVSWWHWQLSRGGFRPVLLPPFLMLSLFFFWRGWRAIKPPQSPPLLAPGHTLDFALAGLFLGLVQYTYLSARLAPLILAGLTLFLSGWVYRRREKLALVPPVKLRYVLIRLWLGLLLTAGVAALVFAPLGLFFLDHPETFSARTGDVVFTPDSLGEGAAHLLDGLTFFWGAGHQLYRHHLPGRAMLGWLEIPFFWVGLLGLLRRPARKRGETWLLLWGLAVMWLPALLASPPVHSLRPVGLLPFYYVIVTLGLFWTAQAIWRLAQRRRREPARFLSGGRPFLLAAALFIGLNGLINSYDYFWRWAAHPEVYKEYNGPLVDLTAALLEQTQRGPVLIPFHLYVHPTTRYLLGDQFTELPASPPLPGEGQAPAQMVLIPDNFQLLYVGNIPPSPAMALLSRQNGGRVSVSGLPGPAEQATINQLLVDQSPRLVPFLDRLGRPVAQILPLPAAAEESLPPPLAALFAPPPGRVIDLTWADQVQLQQYELAPAVARPGQALQLNFYWRSLTEAAFDQKLFLQIVDGRGEPVTQGEQNAFNEDMYRWRPEGILPTQHTLWLGPDLPSGPYLVRMGFFDRHSGVRLPLHAVNGQPVAQALDEPPPIDQIHLGLFYVTPEGDLPPPDHPLAAKFEQSLQISGVSLPDPQAIQPPHLPVTFYWRAEQPPAKPYTVFLQLLDEQGQVVGGWDRQPLAGLYPTTLWSPGETVVDTFLLPLPESGLAPGPYRLISGFYDFETGQRLRLDDGSDFAVLAEFLVEN